MKKFKQPALTLGLILLGTLAFGELCTSGLMLGIQDTSWYRLIVGAVSFCTFLFIFFQLEAPLAALILSLSGPLFAALYSSLVGAKLAIHSLGRTLRSNNWQQGLDDQEMIRNIFDGSLLSAPWWVYLLVAATLSYTPTMRTISAWHKQRASVRASA